MIYLRAGLLFVLVCLHIVGGAAVFRRIFPKESPWLGFIIPSFAIALGCNFIEHGIPLTGLHWLLGITALGSVWAIITITRAEWRFFWKPTIIFLVGFLIPFTLHCIKPDIGPRRDGALDLALISSFCMGDTLPPGSTWLPGFRNEYYYDFTHYCASVLLRLLGVDIGTGMNLAGSLLAGFILFAAGGVAFALAGYRFWVSLLSVVMTASAMDGVTPYLWLFSPSIKEPDDATDFYNHAGDSCAGAFDWISPRGKDFYSTHELFPPGYWSWSGCYHSVAGGQCLIAFAVLCMVEMFNRPRTNWPWIGLAWSLVLLIVCSTWGVPLVALFLLSAVGYCLWRGIYPGNWRFVVLASGAALVFLTPMLLYFLKVPTPPSSELTAEAHTTLTEFGFQWWPVFVPWGLLFLWWRRLHPVVRIIQVIVPISFLVVENCNLGCRLDMTGKCWAYIYAAAWVTLIPPLFALRSWVLRAVALTFVATTALSTCFWADYYNHSIVRDNIAQLTGQGDMRSDPSKGRIWNIVSTVSHKTILTGRDTWAYAENPLLANLNHDVTYVAWCSHCAGAIHPNSFDVAATRDKEVNDLYDGKAADPLRFLHEKGIVMVVIWPDDRIEPAVVAALQKELAPQFEYVDCRGFQPARDSPQCGVFIPSPGYASALASPGPVRRP